MSQDDRDHLNKILDTYRRRLQLLEQQAAVHGINCPPEITIEIEDIRKEIKRLNIVIFATFDAKEDGVYSSMDTVESRLNKIDKELNKFTVKEIKTFSLFGFTIWSTVVERIILFTIPLLFILILSSGGFLAYRAQVSQNNATSTAISLALTRQTTSQEETSTALHAKSTQQALALTSTALSVQVTRIAQTAQQETVTPLQQTMTPVLILFPTVPPAAPIQYPTWTSEPLPPPDTPIPTVESSTP